MSVWRRLGDWLFSGEAPDCPSCRGTGEPTAPHIAGLVYWKGRIERVCFQCKGAGKV